MNTLSVKAAARQLGKSEATIKNWCQQGRLNGEKILNDRNIGVWMIHFEDEVIDAPATWQDDYMALYQQWLGHIRTRVKPKTYQCNLESMARYWRWLGIEPNLEAFSVDGLAKAYSRSPSDQYASRKNTYSAFISFMRWLIQWKHKPGDALDDVAYIRPIQLNEPLRRRLNDVQMKQLYRLIEHFEFKKPEYHARMMLAVTLVLESGLRLSEVTGLEWPQVDAKECCIRVEYGKGGKHRTIPIPAHVLQLLKHWKLCYWQPNTSVFNGLTAQGLGKAFYKIKNKQLDIDFHGLRRTYARRLHDQHVPLEIIRQLLGHSKIQTTMLYIGYNETQVLNHMRMHYEKTSNVLNFNTLKRASGWA